MCICFLAFGSGGGAVGYGVGGAGVVAAEAEGATVAPAGTAVGHPDVFHRATAGTQAACDTGVGCMKRARRHAEPAEIGIDNGGFHPCP